MPGVKIVELGYILKKRKAKQDEIPSPVQIHPASVVKLRFISVDEDVYGDLNWAGLRCISC